MERLIKTLELTNGELYYTKNGNRYLLARCLPLVEIYEKTTSVSAIGRTSPGVKRVYFELVLCQETEFCLDVDEGFFQDTVAFSMKADAYRPDGKFEALHFDRLDFEELAADGTLKFSLACPRQLESKLLSY